MAVRLGLVSAALLVAISSATGETNILTSLTWVVVGSADSGPNPQPINVAVDGQPVGSFTELQVFFNFGGTNLQQVFSLKGEGMIQPILPPPLVPGGAMHLTSYWDCQEGLVPPVGITDLEFSTPKKANAPLKVTGQLNNFVSLMSTDLRMNFKLPRTNEVTVDVRYKLTATRDICVQQSSESQEDEVRVAQIQANFTSSEIYQNNRIRYTRVKDKYCDPYGYDCVTTKESFCADLDNIVGYLYSNPHHLGSETLAFVHTNALPQNTPTLRIDFRTPSHRFVTPQAYVVPTQDPAEPNVTLWGDWRGANNSYREGKAVVRVRVVLIARDPDKPSCDKVKAPAD
jgi:hypothetical protein